MAKDQFDNSLLSAVMRRIHRSRPLQPPNIKFVGRVDRSHGGSAAELWFSTAGCSHDGRGGCTMCNYGRRQPISEDEMINAIQQGLSELPSYIDELTVSPSGSMLDPHEVSPRARNRIFLLINKFPASRYVFETRADTVTTDTITELIRIVRGKKISVEIGLESSQPWISRFCVNKGSHPHEFIRAVELLSTQGIEVYANILLGTPFLSESEAIDDVVHSTRWALANGADFAIIFPVHVKSYTLSAWLYERGLYQPPSLWSLVESLKRLSPQLSPRTNISWYRNYYNEKSKIILSPITCEVCVDEVLELLDEYRDSLSQRVLDELDEIKCTCKDKWLNDIGQYPEQSLPERVLEVYRELASQFLPPDWWSVHGLELQHELITTYKNPMS